MRTYCITEPAVHAFRGGALKDARLSVQPGTAASRAGLAAVDIA